MEMRGSFRHDLCVANNLGIGSGKEPVLKNQ